MAYLLFLVNKRAENSPKGRQNTTNNVATKPNVGCNLKADTNNADPRERTIVKMSAFIIVRFI
jgi:hypothetical protein